MATPKSSVLKAFFMRATIFAMAGEGMSFLATGFAFWRNTRAPACTIGSFIREFYYAMFRKNEKMYIL
jgi:hypothetical protein